MPQPVYAVCAEAVVQDKETHLVTLSNIMEKLTVSVAALEASADDARDQPRIFVERFRLNGIAVWRLGPDEDYDDQFEWSFAARFDDETIVESPPKQFRFGQGKHLYRTVVRLSGNVPLDRNGALTVEFRARRVGQQAWTTQQYSMLVECITAGVEESQ